MAHPAAIASRDLGAAREAYTLGDVEVGFAHSPKERAASRCFHALTLTLLHTNALQWPFPHTYNIHVYMLHFTVAAVCARCISGVGLCRAKRCVCVCVCCLALPPFTLHANTVFHCSLSLSLSSLPSCVLNRKERERGNCVFVWGHG